MPNNKQYNKRVFDSLQYLR